MLIELAKLKEDQYKIDYRIKGEVSEGFWIDDDGAKKPLSKNAYTYGTFDKITEQFIIDKVRSDPYFDLSSQPLVFMFDLLIKTKNANEAYPAFLELEI